LPDLGRAEVGTSVTVTLDVFEDATPLVVGGRIVIVPQKPQASMPVFVHQAIDRVRRRRRYVTHLD
jgi:hypothetical protein